MLRGTPADAQDRNRHFRRIRGARLCAGACPAGAVGCRCSASWRARSPPSAGLRARTPGADLVKRFEELLDAHFLDHWPVARYAEALKVTPTHLSRLMRETYGCPASHMIRDRMVREARRHLVYTNLSISQMAYALRFDDPAYFTRTFT